MRALLIVLLVLTLSLPLFAQTVSVVADQVSYSGSMYYFHQRKVARTTTGVLVVAWSPTSGSGGQIQYSVYDPVFQSWSPAVALSNAPYNALQPALAADELGNIHATWQQRNSNLDPYQIFYAKFDGVSWSTPKKISLYDTEPSEEATIEVGSQGYLWVVWNNDGAGVGNEYVYAIKSTDGGTTWSSTPDVLSSGGTIGTSIEDARVALGSGPGGKMVAAWDNHLTGSALNPRETFVNQYDGSSWRGQELLTDTAASAAEGRLGNRYSAVAIDQNSMIYVFYNINRSSSDPLPQELVMHRKAWDDAWSPVPTTVIESHPSVGMRSVSAVVDSSGIIHLAYRRDVAADTVNNIDEIAYTWTKDGGTTWAPRIVMSRPSYDGGYVTLGNRVRTAYGVDIAWRESADSNTNDQSVTAVLYGNVPYSVITSVNEQIIPVAYEMVSNYPNPFNPSTTVQYQTVGHGRVHLGVYDGLGRLVRTLVDEVQPAGEYHVQWDGWNDAGRSVSTGIYFVRLSTENSVRVAKMMLLK
jgi:hypothetical protein